MPTGLGNAWTILVMGLVSGLGWLIGEQFAAEPCNPSVSIVPLAEPHRHAPAVAPIATGSATVTATLAEWHEHRSRHYLVRTQISPRFSRELGQFMDRVYEVFDRLFPGPIRVESLPEVVVFADRIGYQAVSGDRSRGMFRWRFTRVNGRAQMTEFALYTYADGPIHWEFARFPRHLLLHEGTHQLIQCRAGFHTVPAWFQEGAAMFLEQWDLSAEPEDNVKRIVAARRAVPPLSAALQRGQWPSLAELLSLPQMDVDGFGRTTHFNYQRAEAFFCFLMSRRDRRAVLRAVYADLLDGRPAEARISGRIATELETDWIVWLREKPRHRD